MKYSFPAIFRPEKDDPLLINVCFPDIIGAVTCGTGMDDALYMAKDCLKLILQYAEYARNTVPSTVEYTQSNFPDCIVKLIEVEI